MTLVQIHLRPHLRSASTDLVHESTDDAAEEAGPQVWEDMTVEVALSVMSGAGVGHLLVCDDDGRRTALVTRACLTAVRDSSGYTDRIRLRDITGGHGSSPAALALAR
ncbi:CBS domain-containing protein [Streptomyces sp. NPDC102467]|uniref:CBS domain-containing protein n=1 Tax=Streptomyces sp. NPDC102467 TaxID=3366179 RepID=UPI003808EBD7